jgi:hypothetical protein
MPSLISQLTPYSCALACLESFLADLGHNTTQAEMLANHRDICWNPTNVGTFGAIDSFRLKILASRYLCQPEDFSSSDAALIGQQLAVPRETLFACCHRFRGNDNSNHCIRLLRLEADFLYYSAPGFPYGVQDKVPLTDFFTHWQPTLLKLKAP